eukprot:SAG11_NODE_1494_length_4803_cov_1.551233_5_plen_104_part_00
MARVNISTNDALSDAEAKLEALATELQNFVLKVGGDLKEGERSTAALEDRASASERELRAMGAASEASSAQLRREIVEGDRGLTVELEAIRVQLALLGPAKKS